MMSLSIEEQLDWLIQNGFASELSEIILGKSEYSDMRAFDKLDRHSHRLRTMVLHHLSFVSEFGIERIGETIVKGSKTHIAFPEYFEAWKLAGAPGVSYSLIDEFYKLRSADHS